MGKKLVRPKTNFTGQEVLVKPMRDSEDRRNFHIPADLGSIVSLDYMKQFLVGLETSGRFSDQRSFAMRNTVLSGIYFG